MDSFTSTICEIERLLNLRQTGSCFTSQDAKSYVVIYTMKIVLAFDSPDFLSSSGRLWQENCSAAPRLEAK